MPYASGRVIHDADAHIMEVPGFLEEHPELLAPDTDPWLQEVAVLAAAVAHFRRLEDLSLRAPQAGPSGRPSEWRRSARAGWRR